MGWASDRLGHHHATLRGPSPPFAHAPVSAGGGGRREVANRHIRRIDGVRQQNDCGDAFAMDGLGGGSRVNVIPQGV